MFGELSMITFPLWFKFFLGLFCFQIITGTIRHFKKNQFVSSIEKLPIEKKEKIIITFASVIKIHKLLLFILPISLIGVPYAVYKYQPENFFHISVIEIMVYMMIINDLIFRRSVLMKLKET